MKTLYKNIALFVGGSLFGSARHQTARRKDAKNAYTHATAAVLLHEGLRYEHGLTPFVRTQTTFCTQHRTSTSSVPLPLRQPQLKSRTQQRRSQTRWLLTLHRLRHNLHQSNQKGGRNVPLFPSFSG